jgi:hypothetical protein
MNLHFKLYGKVTEILCLQAASPVCAELETIVLDWFGKFIRINRQYLSSKPLTNYTTEHYMLSTHLTLKLYTLPRDCMTLMRWEGLWAFMNLRAMPAII